MYGIPKNCCGFPQLNKVVAIGRSRFIFLHLVPEGRQAQVEQPGRLALVPVALFQGFPEQFMFQAAHDAVQMHALVVEADRAGINDLFDGIVGPDLSRYILYGDLVPGKEGGTLDDVS